MVSMAPLVNRSCLRDQCSVHFEFFETGPAHLVVLFAHASATESLNLHRESGQTSVTKSGHVLVFPIWLDPHFDPPQVMIQIG